MHTDAHAVCRAADNVRKWRVRGWLLFVWFVNLAQGCLALSRSHVEAEC